MFTVDGVEIQVGKNYWFLGENQDLPFLVFLDVIHRAHPQDPLAMTSFDFISVHGEFFDGGVAQDFFAERNAALEFLLEAARVRKQEFEYKMRLANKHIFFLSKQLILEGD